MKNIKILLILMLILLLHSGVVLAADGEVIEIGSIRGYEQGKIQAAESNTDKTFIPFDKVTLSDEDVYLRNALYLKDKDLEYINIFTNAYLIAFEKGYKEVIKKGEDDKEHKDAKFLSSGFGAAFGTNYGEIAGSQDYERGVSPDWSKSILGDTELISMFDLKSLPSEERYEFLEQFKKNYELGYAKGYYETHFGTIKNSLDAGNTDGKNFGGNIGAIFGSKDYYENKTSDYLRDMPSEFTIRTEYALNLDDEEYLQGFVNGFKKSYLDEYIKSYRETKNYTISMDQNYGKQSGISMGEVKGSMQANIDYIAKKSNDWKRNQPIASSIIFEYNLMYQSENYRDLFIAGFQEGYKNGYLNAYQEVSQGKNESLSISETIPISGGTVVSLDGALAVTINKGTYYKPVILTIDTLNDSLYAFDKNYISASNYYKVSLVNPNNNAYSNENKIEITFEYYGGKKGGVYKMENGKWQYMDSKRDENSITIMINTRNLTSTGNVYAVMLNEEVQIFHDIRGHWAKNEIETLIRRNIIYGYTDKTFKAENKITRAEFLTLLSRVYNWKLPSYAYNTTVFKDYACFENMDKIISYAIANGYIKGYEDNTFRPNAHISYREIEIIMSRLVDENFKWHHTAAKMLYEKKRRSSFYDSIDNKINRGEVSYMLYILNEWRY